MANPQLVGAVLSAAKDNDVAMMGEILTMMPSAAKAGNGIGQTALHVASIWGCTEVARLLIEAGADVDAQNKFGITPLASAAGKDRLQVAKLLLENGADPRLRSANGMTALEVATSDAMRVLLGSPTLEGHKAVIAADRSALEALLNEGSLTLSDQDSDGDTLLHLAVQAAVGEPVGKEPVEFGNTAMLDLLLQHDSAKGFAKAQRAHNDAGLMPLHIAVSRGNVAVCEALLRAKKPDEGGFKLINAVTLKKDKLHDGQWGKKNADGEIERLRLVGTTALHLAVQELADRAEDAEDADEVLALDTTLVRTLLKHGADPNFVDGDEQTPLHIAILGKLHEVVQMLCEATADLSLGCKAFGRGNTALHQATILSDVAMIKLLVQHGADVDAQGRDDWTPLCMAVRSNSLPVVTALLDAKANVSALSYNGKTALEIATINKSKPELIELLKAHS